MGNVTQLLQAAGDGDRDARDRLLEVIYGELRRLAAAKIARERPGHTLEATALVHEAYLRLVGDERASWENRRHFFGAAAEAMRRILVEAARRKGRIKHGGLFRRRELDDIPIAHVPDADDLLALDEALEKLAIEDPTKAELVKMRYFSGLTIEQAGELLDISRATADRYWRFARAWLLRSLEDTAVTRDASDQLEPPR